MESKKQRIYDALEHGNPVFWTLAGVVAVGILGILDYLTGTEFTFSLFYIAPVILVAWVTNLKVGLFMSLLSALTIMSAEIAAGQTYSHSIVYFLNTLVRTIFYLTLTYLVVQLKHSQRKEHLAARTDFVTGIANSRYFHEILNMEVERIRRYPHPITVVYMDMDNFKEVNDLFGHTIGDDVLRYVTSELKIQLRKTDTIARLGGDEFAILLPSTRLEQAEEVIARVRLHLEKEMTQKKWPITFSMGAVVCLAPPHSAEQVIDMADQAMYQVKNDTKNGVCFIIWNGVSFTRR